ncbi:MAG: TIGR04283 family arsenosugar biosynthesis glycosyltransferase [Desulfohalobiaceae bacterium]
MHEQKGLAIFSKYPKPGFSKTRLVPALGPEGAARLQYRMLEHVLHEALLLDQECGVQVQLFYTGGSLQEFQALLGPGLCYVQQTGDSLGERMHKALQSMLDQGLNKVLLIGSDCPQIHSKILEEAYQALENADVVFGPAQDGGYYLVGLSRPAPELFQGIAWGQGNVLEQSLRAAAQAGLEAYLLQTLQDVDQEQDLQALSCEEFERISVIIPTLNEAQQIEGAIQSAQLEGSTEVIVVDGGSQDKSREIAEKAGAKVLHSAPGRAEQQNLGAAQARGGILLFLHADTRLPAGYARQVRELLQDPEVVLGAFALRIEGASGLLRLVQAGTNLRSRWLRLPYGDQGLFLRCRLFKVWGGFARLRIMEDFELVKRAGRQGRVQTLQTSVSTSKRRWQKRGLLRTTFLNQLMILGYHLGLSQERLESWYGRRGGGDAA